MALKGAANEPIPVLKGAKPRLWAPKVRRRAETLRTARLGEYLPRRNALLELRFKRESTNLGHDRDQLIEKSLVERQLSWLLISMRNTPAASQLEIGVKIPSPRNQKKPRRKT